MKGILKVSCRNYFSGLTEVRLFAEEGDEEAGRDVEAVLAGEGEEFGAEGGDFVGVEF